MSLRFSTLVALSALVALPALALAASFPTTTDEARAVASKMLPAEEALRPVPPGTVAGSTDEARELARRMLPRSQQNPVRAIATVSSTDEARAVAGGLLVVAPAARHEVVASCGKSCNCGHSG